jgi:hypothetical protein
MTNDKALKLVVALNKETIQDNIKWVALNAPETFTEGSSDIIHIIYKSKFKDFLFALYQRRYRHYFDEDAWSWGEGLVLAIINENDKVLWDTYEQSQALRDLYNSVTKQASGFNNILDDLLSK